MRREMDAGGVVGRGGLQRDTQGLGGTLRGGGQRGVEGLLMHFGMVSRGICPNIGQQ